MLHHPFLFKGKPTHAQEVARRISGAVAGESTHKSRHTKYPSQLVSFTLHYLPFSFRFPLPHFTLAVLFALFSFHPLFSVRLFSLAFCVFVLCAAVMSETGEVIVDKDNNMENFDAIDDPLENPTILHTKKFRIGSGNIIGK